MNTPNIPQATPQAAPQSKAAPNNGVIAAGVVPATPLANAMDTTSSNTTSKTLLDTAVAKGNFSTFAKAVEQAGLSETLRGAGPFTVFAPTDAAFAKLPTDKLDALMKPENKNELASILKYHVLSGRKNVADMGKWDAVKTINGQSAPIKMTDGKFSVDGAHITDGDIGSSNGIIHGIDKVLLPTAAKA
jgi:uncharacterized surface protein with fasciclin (FAS1) repeats